MASSVLVADDDTDFREAVEAALRAFGFDVRSVTTVDELCRCVEQDPPDVVLSDVRMPGDGSTVPRRVQALRPGTPVVVMTGLDEPGVRERVMREGAFAYVEKPMEIAHLRGVLEAALRNRSA
jgi:DNA-binding NtrC family response regulator